MAETIRRAEIHEHVRRRFLEHLERRLRLLRKLYVGREWAELRAEIEALAETAPEFGLGIIAQSAEQVIAGLPEGRVSRAKSFPGLAPDMERLFSTIDTTLVSDKMNPLS